MSDKINYKIWVSPIEDISDEDGNSHFVTSGEVGRTLGGFAQAVVTDYSGVGAIQGYTGAVVSYREALDDVDTVDISTEATATFVYIRNTGYTYASTSTVGAALNKGLKVMVGTTMISILDAGECMVLKDDNAGLVCTGIHVRTVDLDGGENASAGHLAVEFLVVD